MFCHSTPHIVHSQVKNNRVGKRKKQQQNKNTHMHQKNVLHATPQTLLLSFSFFFF
jgi:hypothetical protein